MKALGLIAGVAATIILAPALLAGGTNTPAAKGSATNVPTVKRDRPMGINEKMESIIIPAIELRQANIADVADFLTKASRENDPAEGANKGINFILNLSPGGAKPPPVPQITFSANNITLLQALRTITRVAGLTYRTEGNIVMIVPAR